MSTSLLDDKADSGALTNGQGTTSERPAQAQSRAEVTAAEKEAELTGVRNTATSTSDVTVPPAVAAAAVDVKPKLARDDSTRKSVRKSSSSSCCCC